MPVSALFFAVAAAVAPTAITTAPISDVTVFSDRALVTRTVAVPLSGHQRLVLPLLLDSIDVGSLRVGATGGEVDRVDITYVPAGEFPHDRAQQLLDELEALDAQIDRAQKERQVWQTLLDTVRAVRPTIASDPFHPPAKLNPAGWNQAVALVRGNQQRAQAKIEAQDLELRALGKKRVPLSDEAAKLGALVPRSGYRVTAFVHGRGTAHLTISYMVRRARWVPTYDITLQPATGKVDLKLAGNVSQETGEDWTAARLTLSTAVPATATRYPKVGSWTIGEKERFIPTPRPVEEYAPPAPPVNARVRSTNGDDVLRRALSQRVQSETRAYGQAAVDEKNVKEESKDRDGDGIPDVADRCPDDGGGADGCPSAGDDQRLYKAVPKAEPMPPSPAPIAMDEMVAHSRPQPTAVVLEVARSHRRGEAMAGAAVSPQPTEALGLLPPGGWVRPTYAAGLPASLAGGYDLTFHSIAVETVPSGKGTRRVALLARTWPVTVERKLFPALAPDAYLVAELKSPEKDPLPGGTANLFVGADPAGVATLGLITPGESFTLPLGLDPAVRPVRNVRVSTVEKGVISKDEISEYTVTIEVANPYRNPLSLRVVDQIPLTPNKTVEVKVVRMSPEPAAQDAVKGSLEWRLSLGANQKTTITYVYTLKRPKGYRLYQ